MMQNESALVKRVARAKAHARTIATVGPFGSIGPRHQEIAVTEFLQTLCIPAHIKGYHYLREAVLFAIDNQRSVVFGNNVLYPHIAAVFDTTPALIESGIRYALHIAWKRFDMETVRQEHAVMNSFAYGKPTNSEFIARVADYFTLRT